MEKSFEIEKQEAIAAGRRALDSLHKANEYLNSAGNWGIVDILGGGFLTSAIKHSKMSNAREELMQAQFNLEKFADELKDIDLSGEGIKFTNFFSLVDVFSDNFLADVIVQHRIGETRDQVRRAIGEVEFILTTLEKIEE